MDHLYLDHFGLKEPAFNITPDPSFLYLSSSHREALAQLSYGVKARKGFIVLTGEVGTGKTTLIRTLLTELDGSTRSALIFFSVITTPLDLLRAVCEEFGLVDSGAARQELHDYLQLINQFLLERYRTGDNCALIIDEAQNLSSEVLESVRLLSNFETAKDKLLQIFLVGQPELATRLNSPALRQLKQRVTLRHHLRPLSLPESREYIMNRLRLAGGNPEIFLTEAIQRIHDFAGGIPRLINVICDNAMVTAFALDKRSIDQFIIREVAEDLSLTVIPRAAAPATSVSPAGVNGAWLSRKPSTQTTEYSQTQQPAPNKQPVANNLVSSAPSGVVMPRNSFDDLIVLLTDAMGPMATVVVRDCVKHLGGSLDEFPREKFAILIDAVSQEILDESMRRMFQRSVPERLRTWMARS